VPGAEQFEFKEFTAFSAPFEICGTAFIIYRYADPFREDEAGLHPEPVEEAE